MPIHIRGASEHNLRGVDVVIGDGLTVVTGVSGSGKTSLVFDTLYHESRRRMLEVYALGASAGGGRLAPARVEGIDGLGPAVAVGQNLLNRNPASTLATASGLHPFLRLLYARYGERRCATCGAPLSLCSEDEIIERLVAESARGSLAVLAPLLRGVWGSHRTLLSLLSAGKPGALRVDDRPWEGAALDPAAPHDLDVVVAEGDRPLTPAAAREAIDRAAALGAQAVVLVGPGGLETLSRAPACAACGTWFGDLEPIRFRTPCPHCKGAGCARCEGTGIHPEAAAVRWQGLRLPDLLARSVSDCRALFSSAPLPATAARLGEEIARRLEALERVGLGYIALERPSPTLSRGEAQRVRLAVALTSRLEDLLHVLDEPTIGLHPADVERLMPALRALPGPVVFVEHDRVAAAAADEAIDLGPGAGAAGGRLVYRGTPEGLWKADTPTGRCFSLRERVASLPERCHAPERFLSLRGAHARNLQEIDVSFPIGRVTVVTGVSGSGKSTLVEEVLARTLAAGAPTGCRASEGPALCAVLVDQSPIGHNPRSNPATYTGLADLVRDLFARGTGLSPSHFSFNRPEGACPACGGLGATEVAMRYLPSTWVPCTECDGQRFSDEVLAARVPLGGREASIADLYALSIAEARGLLAERDLLREAERAAAGRILDALVDIGLGYLPLGQPSTTLSGGEAQRVKLARYLGRKALRGQCLILDEPSTGLHPQDIAGLLAVLGRLARGGATVVVVEHNADVIRAADWAIDLGPGAGPAGGRVLYQGPAEGLAEEEGSRTGRALREEEALRPQPASTGPPRRAGAIAIRGARAHNLQDIDVDILKGAWTVVTGVSGSGKSSLVGDVLEVEARRRYLESLSLYERQALQEGPEAPVEAIAGLGVALAVPPERRLHDRRATVGTASEVSHHLAVLLATAGERACPQCGASLVRGEEWHCPSCGARAPIARPRHFDPRTYAAACRACHGVGSQQVPRPEKLVLHPERPLCDGAMYSPGFFPKGYLCQPLNGGYDMVQALAARYGFDPATTPWNAMSPEAQQAFLFGDSEPLEVHFTGRSGRQSTGRHPFPGFYGWVRDWDTGGTYTDTVPCPACGGARLRAEYLAVTLEGYNAHALNEMPLSRLAGVLDEVAGRIPPEHQAATSLRTARRRLGFLGQVGLGYLHLNRPASTLSAGEAQRIRLAGLLGSGLTSLTILADEPSRGLHPAEVQALADALRGLRDEGNTVIVVEHDEALIRAADRIIDMGPGAGAAGGRIVAQGTPAEVSRADTPTGRWLRGEVRVPPAAPRGEPRRWLVVRGPRANNLRGEDVHMPLGMLVGLCGVSGAGKSSLLVDTLGRALAPKKYTTSVAQEPLVPGPHEGIDGAPARAIIVDQTRAGIVSPASYLGLERPLRALLAATPEARALGLDEKALGRRCSACNGTGFERLDMGFLPDVYSPCETCRGTGCVPEAWQVRWRGASLPELLARTIDEVHALLAGEEPEGVGPLLRALGAARDVGLGYLVLRQPGHALSGGEVQRLKIAAELARPTPRETLYLLDEPTVGQHGEDVIRLVGVLRRLVAAGHTVLVGEHHPYLLAACDWLVELGPGGGPEGGCIVAQGPPARVAAGDSPTAPYLREILGRGR